jgi:hypothetical protein
MEPALAAETLAFLQRRERNSRSLPSLTQRNRTRSLLDETRYRAIVAIFRIALGLWTGQSVSDTF